MLSIVSGGGLSRRRAAGGVTLGSRGARRSDADGEHEQWRGERGRRFGRVMILVKHRDAPASAGKLGAIVREYGSPVSITQFRVSEVAALLGVSDDTVRRWADAGRLTRTRTSGGPALIDGAEVARLAQELAAESALHSAFRTSKASARNRITGIVTKVTKDGVMAQVELQAGPFRLVSLMSREAADELGLVPGSLAVASAKATTIVVEVPE
jgi:molybdopterin-binding protein